MKKNIPYMSFISPALGFIVCLLIIIFYGKTPGEAIVSLFTGTFTSKYYLGAWLNSAAFLMLAGSGACIAIKSGNMNLGGEGQVYLGGFIAGLILSSDNFHSPLLQFAAALFLCIICTGTMAQVSAFLKEKRGAEVLLTSFLLSAAFLPLIDGIITYINGKSNQNLIALPYIKDCFKFRRILQPSTLTMSFFFAAAVCAGLYIFFEHTFTGRKTLIWGKAPLFAQYCGYSSKANSYLTLGISGALHGLTGFIAVCGTYYTCHKGFYTGMGWDALSAALIVGANPLMLIPSSLVLAWLYTSADRIALTQGFNFDISGMVQGCILFAIAIPFAAGSLESARKSRETRSQEK